jgi:hypothetical protein
MKRISTVGLCFVVALVMSALAAASASAASPEYKTCKKVTSGREFSDKGCTVAAGGAGKGYKLAEWNEGKKTTFKSKGTAPVNKLINPVEKKVEGQTECASEKGAGETTGSKTTKFTNGYKKCKSAGKTCETAGAGKGQIKTKPLVGTLIPLGAGSGQGTLVTPESGEVLAEYNCEGLEITAKGAVIGEIQGAAGAASKSFTTHLRAREGKSGNLQEYLYIGGAGTEAEEEEAQDYFEYVGCLKKGNPKAVCEGAVGDGKEPAKPITVISFVEPIKAVAPATQESVTTTKGEAIKIV